MLVELPSGKEDFGIGEPVGEEDFGSFNDLVGGDEPLVHVGMQRGREALAATVAVFQIALLVESSVSSQDPPEADKSDGQKALEEAFEIALAGSGVQSQRAASRRDVWRAVLLAAIASEVKIKDTLRQKTPDHRRELAEVTLKNWREVDIAIAELPHKPMKGAIGRSLHEDDPDLFAAVRALFTRRNAIAHRGEAPTLAEARDSVGAAVGLSAWLDSLPAP
jgi:hypothetical protein